jgi:FKBP-type peptidyl-prolyl cis-trans isomerase FkpA
MVRAMSGRRSRLFAASALAGVAAMFAIGAGGCGRKPASRTLGGVSIEDLRLGSGAIATPGKVVSAHYTGRFPDGAKFDSSYDAGLPIEFLLGAGKVIKGWDVGIEGMKVGGKRKLTIPPELAYGSRGGGPIPPNATLVFDVELVAVK